MKNVKENFLKLVEEFNLDFNNCKEDMECRTDFYALYPGAGGFLIESYWDYETCIRVATHCYRNRGGVYFMGNKDYSDFDEAREQVMKMIKEAKKHLVQNNISNIEKDFT